MGERLLGVLEDTGVPPVGISPRDPWKKRALKITGYNPTSNWNGKQEIDSSQKDETPVAVVSHRATGDETLELLSPLHKGKDSEDWG